MLCHLFVGHAYVIHGYLLNDDNKALCPRCGAVQIVSHSHSNFISQVYSGASTSFRSGQAHCIVAFLDDESRVVQSGNLFSFLSDAKCCTIYLGCWHKCHI